MPSLHRRRFLELGAAAATVALAGCSGSDETPPYAERIPASDSQIRTAYLDFSISRESSETGQLLPLVLPSDERDGPSGSLRQVSGLDAIEDPLLTWPIEVGGRMLAVSILSLAASGLGYLVDPDRPTQEISELFMANNVAVGTGEIDLDRAKEALRSGTSGISGEMTFEEAGEIDAFALYEPTAGEFDGVTAVSESAVLVTDTREEIRRVIETARGNRSRAADEMGSFEWLVETIGGGDIVAGWLGPMDLENFYFGDPEPRPASELVRPDDDVLASITVSPSDGEVTADLALQRPGMAESTREELRSQFGSASEETSLSVENGRLTATGTYTNDVLDFEFSKPGKTNNTDDQPGPSGPVDPPQEVANAVPDDAFEFTYQNEQNRVIVEVVEELQADRITISTVESGYEFEISDPGDSLRVYAYIDPDGDQVVVTVTVDGVSGVVARREFT